jgi:hypothetical protein
MSNDDRPTAPFPGIPVTADLHGGHLTIYWPADPATGHIPSERLAPPYGGWTRDQILTILGDYGLVLKDLRTTHAADAFVTTLAGVVAIAERVHTAAARVARALSDATAVPVTHGPRA